MCIKPQTAVLQDRIRSAKSRVRVYSERGNYAAMHQWSKTLVQREEEYTDATQGDGVDWNKVDFSDLV